MIDQSQIENFLKKDLAELADFLVTALKRELIDQGHVMTGRMRDSIELAALKLGSGSIEAFVEMENYYGALDEGVRANRIPFHPGSGRKTSKYIDGLINFWMIKRGLSKDEATRAAFATARKHKKEGMPAQSSWQFATNGRRLQFMTRTIEESKHYDGFESNIQNQFENVSERVLDEFELSLP